MRYIIIFLFIYHSISVYAQKVSISLFNDSNLKSAIFSIYSGEYKLFTGNDKSISIKKNDLVTVSDKSGRISVSVNSIPKGNFDRLDFRETDSTGCMKIKPVFPSLEPRRYKGEFKISLLGNKLLIVNVADIDEYIAGVVESEGGEKSAMEYYKTQAIICRTYALAHFDRHLNEGFQLCDGIHCQVYLGMSFFRPEIKEATKITSGLVIVDQDNKLVTAAFHSNCGGYTVNSEDVWSLPKPYLVSVCDSFCLKSPHAVWDKTITVRKWISYLRDNGFRNTETLKPCQLCFNQPRRKQYYSIGNDSVPLKKIRNDWELRSTFFSITNTDSTLVFKGRGYGHGAGLCQEGAMVMAEKGKSYVDIISFYYTNVKIIKH
ncbi:MAG: SpoIID/LytB domain-containing protein [Bacteroidia bacterium]|nr:SpoIID/LytB domain-containing protein [Bacteroidia bacterium]